MVQHRRQRGRFSRAGRAGDQDQPLFPHRHFGQDRREVQVLHRLDLGGDDTEDGSLAAALHETVHAEPADAGQFDGEIELVLLLEGLLLDIVHDVPDQRVKTLAVQRREVEWCHVAVDADQGRHPGREVEVRGALVLGEDEEFGNVHQAAARPASGLVEERRAASGR
ncbi:MAG: hypothetical protein FD129_3392 [bacterium]|nr:MAG: hypothetical protein FD129_3392 [bacterium]